VDLKYAKNALTDPAGEAHDAPLDPIVGWKGGHPLPNPTSFGAFGALILAPVALSFCGPQCKIRATPLRGWSVPAPRWAVVILV